MKRLPNLHIRIFAGLVLLVAIGWFGLQGFFNSSETESGAETQTVAAAGDNADAAQTDAPILNIHPLPLNSATSTPEPLSRGERLLVQTREMLQIQKPFRTQLTQTIRIGERPLQATGSYIEGSGYQLRMELKVETPSTTGHMLNVCDGSILWTELTRLSPELSPEGTPRITRRDLGSILQEAHTSSHVDNARFISDLAMGGLTALFASLQREMDFEDPIEFTHSGVSLWKLQGTWSQAFLDRHQVSNIRKMPRHIPDGVEIYLDRQTLFPHRILFTRHNEEGEPLKLITFDFTDVQLRATLTDDLFDYLLAGESYDDVTNQYLRRLQEVGH
ncbi:MAG: hypothetical protein CMJ46_08625 [Planctomyces sp.]|nr:hypothetical protein [Planctomyces sp.]